MMTDMVQMKLQSPPRRERRRELFCDVCQGETKLCKFANCPKLAKVREWYGDRGASLGTTIFGPTPPGAFVGEWGYPRVLTGPLVPAFSGPDPALLDDTEKWVHYPLEELLALRLSMVRGKAPFHVWEAPRPTRVLAAVQEGIMASRPTDMEMELTKKPNLDVLFSPRSAPVGPSAPIAKVTLAGNPSIPRKVDSVVSDTDLKAGLAVMELYESGIPQNHITKLFSVGLLGDREARRLVPTEWSITATDDILGRALHRRILEYPVLDEYRVFTHEAVANRVHVLLLPTPWMFEALEAWLVGPGVTPAADHEFREGRKDYPQNIAGGYHAARLPVLEYLEGRRRQAGAVVFLEILREWVPLGVWRFREIARVALGQPPFKTGDLGEALGQLAARLQLPLERWLDRSRILDFHRHQRRLEAFGGFSRYRP